MPVQRNNSQHIYGYPSPISNVFPQPYVQTRAPLGSDQGEIGQLWVNTNTNLVYILTSVANGASVWSTNPFGAIQAASMTVTNGDLEVVLGNATIDQGVLTVSVGPTNLQALVATSIVDTGALTVGGAVVIGGALTVAGIVTANGGYDLNTAGQAVLESTDNVANAFVCQTNGGAAETIVFKSIQGTGVNATQITATAGGVLVTGGLANAAAVRLNASNAAGGITLSSGTGGMTLSCPAGAFSLNTTTGAIGISTDASATAINIGTGAAVVKTISIGGTGANVIAIGDTQTGGSVSIGAALTGGTITIGSAGVGVGTITLGQGTGVQSINIGITNGVKTINIGSGVSGNAISIGNGVNTGAQSIMIAGGNAGAASTVSIQSGGATAGLQTVNIGTGTSVGNRAINIGSGASSNAVIIGSKTTTSATTIRGGTGAINLDATGLLTATSVKVTAAAGPNAAAAGVIDSNCGRLLMQGYTQAAAATLTVTITCAVCTLTSTILVTATSLGAEDAQLTVTKVRNLAGSFVVTLTNLGAAALASDCALSFWILN